MERTSRQPLRPFADCVACRQGNPSRHSATQSRATYRLSEAGGWEMGGMGGDSCGKPSGKHCFTTDQLGRQRPCKQHLSLVVLQLGRRTQLDLS